MPLMTTEKNVEGMEETHFEGNKLNGRFPEGFCLAILKEYDGKACNLMISGGSVAALLDREAYSRMDTSKWRIFYSDERSDRDNLNYDTSKPFLARLDAVAHPIQVSRGMEAAVNLYTKTLEDADRMDVCLLGVGDNGHVCSLWPDSAELNRDEWVVGAIVDYPISPQRITVTLAYLNNRVKKLYFVIPLKNGMVKSVTEPHQSIKNKLQIPYTIVLHNRIVDE